MADPVPPGGMIGILGGGQLGRMLALGAAKLGLRAHIFSPEPDCPAFDVTPWKTCASYDDAGALEAFALSASAVTYEFENIPASALAALEAHAEVRPPRRALEIAQNRLKEKEFLRSLGIPTAPYRLVASGSELEESYRALLGRHRSLPMYLKRVSHGYDGKGQLRITQAAGLGGASRWLGASPALLEHEVAFGFEISVIAVRGSNGAAVIYEPSRNTHISGILRESIVPAGADESVADIAKAYALQIMEALHYVGVIGVEMFALASPAGKTELLVNEIAPRVHNTGHWTLDACAVSQFENHIRAVAGWPLGPAARHSGARMVNLIGEEAAGWEDLLKENASRSLYLYGKREMRAGRKMGHYTDISKAAADFSLDTARVSSDKGEA